MKTSFLPFAALAAALVAGSAALAAPPPAGAVRVRGSVQSLKDGVLTVASSSGPVKVTLPPKAPVVSVVPSSRDKVRDGAFLGIASVAGPGGAQQAREVVVFPEAARGTGEGSYDWDLPGTVKAASGKSGSRMTNGTVRSRMTNGTVSGSPGSSGSRMTNGTVPKSRMTNGTVKKGTGPGTGAADLVLEFRNGSGKGTQKITLPPGIPFVTFEAGQRSQLTPGAHVIVFGQRGTGGVTAERVLVGKNGLVPPM